MKYWQIEHTEWFHPSFEPDMKYWQIKHTGWFHPSFEPDMKYWQIEHSVVQSKFWTRHEVLTNWTYRKIPFESVELDKLNIHGDSIQVLNQTWRTDKLNIPGDSIQTFWTRHEVLTYWTYRVILSKSLELDMKYWQIEHTGRFNPKLLNQTWSTDKLHIHSDSTNLSIPYKWVIFPGT